MSSRTSKHIHRISSADRRGSLLLIVLVTVAILALSVLSFSSLMLVEEQVARVMTRQVQSKYLVDSGMEYTRIFLTRPENEIVESGGLWDNQPKFRGIAAVADINMPGRQADIGRFTLVAPGMGDDGVLGGTRYGVVNESSKINVNVLPYYDFYDRLNDEESNSGRDILLGLPGMTEEIADAILDFIDVDDDEREYGTEGGYYGGLSPAYAAKNGPLDSIDELLLIRGVTPELLFGLDTNRNGVLDDSEASLGDVSMTDAESVLGWANYLTLYSKESNLNREGLPKININTDDLDQLYDDLKSVFNDDWANFIIAYRLGNTQSDPTDPELIVSGSSVAIEIPEDAEPDDAYKFVTLLDMIDVSIEAENSEGETVWIESPIKSPASLDPAGASAIPIAMEALTVYEGIAVPGRINIRQAPRVVLSGIPGMTEELLDAIIEKREIELDDPSFLDRQRKYETFLLMEPGFITDPQQMRDMMPYICAGGDVYRAEIVGYFGDGRGTSRAEVVFDRTLPIPKILMWRDKSHLQTGYSIEALGSELQAVGSELAR